MKVSNRAGFLGGAAFFGCLLAQPAAAQDGSASQTSAEADRPSVDPGEIIVTAQRREERLQEVPISIAVVTGETLTRRGVQSFVDLAPLVPNLSVSRGVAANATVLRGVGSGTGSPSLDQSVVFFIDGIYAGNARQFQAPFMDIDRFEVLRGPQGALVGRNTSAGAINIITRRPTDTLSGYVDATYNFLLDGPAIEGALNVPVTEGFSIRATGRYADLDGYINNTSTGKEDVARKDAIGRLSAKLESGPVTIFAKYEHSATRERGSALQPIAPAFGQVFDYRNEGTLVTEPQFNNVDTDNVVVQVDMDLGGPILTATSGYSGFKQRQRVDADFLAANLAVSDFDQKFTQFSQEIRIVSPNSARLRYVFGAYYSQADLYEQRTTGTNFAPAASTYRTFDQTTEALSAFGSLSYNLTEELRLNGSLRYTREKKSAMYRRFGGALAHTQRTGPLVATIFDKLSEGTWDPSASIQYFVTPDVMLYASYGRGSKSGGFQGAISNAAPFAFQFAPERSESYEAGARLSFPGLGYFNVAVFDTTYTGLQVSIALPSPDGTSAPFFTGNAPKARIRGLEADMFFRLSSQFEISGSLGWLPRARYGTFTNGPCYVQQAPNGSQPGSCNLTGARLGFASKYSGSFSATFRQPVGSGMELTASLSPTFQGPSFRDFTIDPVLLQRSFIKLDGRIALLGDDERWELAVIGTNLTNKRTLAFGGAGGLVNTFLTPSARIGVIDAPRAISVQARYKF